MGPVSNPGYNSGVIRFTDSLAEMEKDGAGQNESLPQMGGHGGSADRECVRRSQSLLLVENYTMPPTNDIK